MCSDVEENKTVENMKIILDHSRSLFVYHAGQRLNSIRYFFAIFGVILVGYISLYKEGRVEPYIYHASLAVVAFFGFSLCLVYFFLDIRNEQLVHIDENAMHYAESKLAIEISAFDFESAGDYPAAELTSYYNARTSPLMISRVMDKSAQKNRYQGAGAYSVFSYSYVMRFTFLLFCAASAIALVTHVYFSVLEYRSIG